MKRRVQKKHAARERRLDGRKVYVHACGCTEPTCKEMLDSCNFDDVKPRARYRKKPGRELSMEGFARWVNTAPYADRTTSSSPTTVGAAVASASVAALEGKRAGDT